MADITACVAHSDLFLHPLLDDTAQASTGTERRRQEILRTRATAMCASCPVQGRCLTDAVARFDVAGFVAGTTRKQRKEIRARLGVDVTQDDLDSFTGAPSGRQFDRREIYRMRMANPALPLSSIAAKIGCSVSTVKRHLRRIEEEGGIELPQSGSGPSAEHVLAVAAEVREGIRRDQVAA